MTETVVYKQLDKYRSDVKKLEKRYSEIGKKLGEARKVLQNAERDQFMEDLNSRGITPEQLAMLLNAANAGQVPGITGELANILGMPGAGNAANGANLPTGAVTTETDAANATDREGDEANLMTGDGSVANLNNADNDMEDDDDEN